MQVEPGTVLAFAAIVTRFTTGLIARFLLAHEDGSRRVTGARSAPRSRPSVPPPREATEGTLPQRIHEMNVP